MKYAVNMGSGAMIYIPSFIKIGSGIQKFQGFVILTSQSLRL
jgi:predicted RNA-binding protein with TRAM domain